jgi:hypothetical protein
MFTAYFDTNIFDEIQRSGGPSCPAFAIIARAREAGIFRISISHHVIDETVAAYGTRPEATLERLLLIETLADPYLVVRPAADILHDHVVAALASEPGPSSFLAAPLPLQQLRGTLIHDFSVLQALLDSNRLDAETHAATLRQCQAEIRAKLETLDWPKVAFSELLEDATWMLQTLVDWFFGPGDLPDGVLRILRRSRPIAMYQAASLSLFYAHSVEGNRPRASDLPDLHHAVAAANADAFVTGDTRLVPVVRRVPLRDFRVFTLPEFLERLGAHT